MLLSEAPLYDAVFLKRTNRFVSEVRLISGEIVKAHMPNTGRMGELLIPGASLRVAYLPSPKRKTAYTVLCVLSKDVWVCTYAAMANVLAFDYLKKHQSYDLIQREKVFLNSRFDLYAESGGKKYLWEVKSVNLIVMENNQKIALFPDAPTSRGVKHVKGLIRLAEKGYECGVIFVVLRADAEAVKINGITDPDLAKVIDEADRVGVNMSAIRCAVDKNTVTVEKPLPFNGVYLG